MTVDSSTSATPESVDAPTLPPVVDTTSRPYLLTSLAFLVLAVLVLVDAGIQLLLPDVFAGVAVLSFGRLLPLVTDAFIFGWLTIGLAGGLLHVVARAGNVDVAPRGEARAALGLLAIGVVAGSVALLFGLNQGIQYFEYPLWADAVLLAGMLLLARVVGRTARKGAADAGPVRWYAVAAAWWLPLAFIAGNIPGISGVGSVTQGAFARTALIGLWVVPAGLAIVYHLVARITGRETFTPTRLTLLGFWSLAFVWALTAPASLVYSAVPDWLETVGGIFSIGLLIPVAVILTDLLIALRRCWRQPHHNARLRFLLLGMALFAVWPFLNLALAMRSSSGIVQYTDWGAAVAVVGLFGTATAWLVAYGHHAAPRLMGSGGGPRLAAFQYYAVTLGLIVWGGAALLAGASAGWTWVATANEAAIPQGGVGFVNTLATVEGYYAAVFVGQVIYVLGLLAYVVGVLRKRRPETSRGADGVVGELDPELALDREVSPRRLRAGALALFGLAALIVWLVPWAETAGAEATLLADTSRSYVADSAEAAGRAIYIAEGCWYCHTQQVRPIVTDVGLGPVSDQGDFVHETPALFGVQRVGQDLMHVGSRQPTDDAAWVAGYLADPRGARSYSIMPSYDYLSETDLEDLAAYIAGSK